MSCFTFSALRRDAATLALLGALVPLAGAAQAAPLTLDFEGLTGVYYMPGTLVAAESRLADQFLASHGVRFSSGAGYAALVDLGVGHASSGSIGVGATTPEGRLTYVDHEVRVSFFNLVDGEAGVTDYVGWYTDRAGDGRLVTLKAYDVHGSLLAQQSWTDTGRTLLSLAVPGMHSVAFSGSGSAALDDLSFNPVTSLAVPEPTTAALLGIGLAALSLWRRRR